ncbi:MAG: hypothetical protein IPH44_17685 [Myxococcales bacterium]|nr:hypothetical protein [Myxococcales bacterium]MBK7196739.1 hypothetical protein [Myxococcales bacterium]MBP6843847.1 hypothetical protein [Kofleriaceae bacterium]
MGALLGGSASTVHVELGATGEVKKEVAPYGPGDVKALDARAVVRTVPYHGVHDFEPNLFPCIELAQPELPWLLSPSPDSHGRVSPWLVLVVVEDRPGVTISFGAGNAQILTIEAPAVPGDELPDLAQSWAWAHAQATGTEGTAIDLHAFGGGDDQARSRLIAPRRLNAGSRYIGCVVPAYAAGVAAVLGSGAQDGPAWTGSETSVRLPVYFTWRFATGPGGDFASLVKLVTPIKLGPDMGHRAADISAPRWGVTSVPGATVEVGSALRSPAWTPPDLSAEAATVGDQITAEIDASDGVLPPPFYGAVTTRREQTSTAPTWQRALNHDVRQRTAAGLGAAVVRANLDAMVDAAWREAGDAERANHTIRHAEVAAEISHRLARRHLQPIDDDGEVLSIARPQLARMHARAERGARDLVRTASPSDRGPTLAAAVRGSAMPDAALAASLRRLGRSGGPLQRASTTRVKPGKLLADIDAARISPVPPRVLASGAAGFDDTSEAEHERPRLHLATVKAVDEAELHWKGHRERRTTGRAGPVEALTRRRTDIPDGEGDSVPPPISDDPEPEDEAITEFAAAARAHQRYIVGKLEKIRDRAKPPLGDLKAMHSLGDVRAVIESHWEPMRGIIPIVTARIADALPAAVSTLHPVQVTPVLEQPLVRALQALSPEHVLRGVGGIVTNRVALSDTAPEFVRAFLVGANDELGRELLWRGFPGAHGHTWMRTFWGRTVADPHGRPAPAPDISAIETWPDEGVAPTPASLVLVVRADVLQRYPNALVYAAQARWDGTHRVVGGGAPMMPSVAATLGSDLALFGFDLTDGVARGSDTPPGPPGYYFVIAEHPSEPRFGLAAAATGSPTAWRELAWSDLAAGDLDGPYLRTDGPLAARQFTNDPLRWGVDASATAAITRRRAIRVAMHASTLME